MTPVLALLGLMLGAWSVRSICIKAQSNPKKLIKSLISAAYFLGAGGFGGEQALFVPTLIVLLTGGGIQLYANKRYAPERNNEAV